MSSYYVYILASGKNGTLYVGVTNDLIRRIQEHKKGLVKGCRMLIVIPAKAGIHYPPRADSFQRKDKSSKGDK